MMLEKEKKGFQKMLRDFRETTGKAALWIDDDSGQIFEIPDCELQFPPPWSSIAKSRPDHAPRPRRSIDLVGDHPNPRAALQANAPNNPVRALPARPPQLLLGKRGGP
jgi:hypothetical protein